MEVRLDGEIYKAKLTTDNPDHKWEIRIVKPDGTVLSFFTREKIEGSKLAITKTTNLEWEALRTAGFQPPFYRE